MLVLYERRRAIAYAQLLRCVGDVLYISQDGVNAKIEARAVAALLPDLADGQEPIVDEQSIKQCVQQIDLHAIWQKIVADNSRVLHSSDNQYSVHLSFVQILAYCPAERHLDFVYLSSLLELLTTQRQYFHSLGKIVLQNSEHDCYVRTFGVVTTQLHAQISRDMQKKQQDNQRVEQLLASLENKTATTEDFPISLLGKHVSKEDLAYRALHKYTGSKQIPSLAKKMLQLGLIESPLAFFDLQVDEFYHSLSADRAKADAATEQMTDFGDENLPLAEQAAFTVDDEGTVEFDDALSIRKITTPEGGYEMGVHISIPALAIIKDSALYQHAWAQCSSFYSAHRKFLLLPDKIVEKFSFKQGGIYPAMSLYITLDEELNLLDSYTKIDRIKISANYSNQSLQDLAPTHLDKQSLALMIKASLKWDNIPAKQVIEQRLHFCFADENYHAKDAQAQVEVQCRYRNVIDDLVESCMRFVNQTWALRLKEFIDSGKYAQIFFRHSGKNKTYPMLSKEQVPDHQVYAWFSSPLRRCVDMTNQLNFLQAFALFPFTKDSSARKKSDYLPLAHFEVVRDKFLRLQALIERYWLLAYLSNKPSVRWTARSTVTATGKVRLCQLPLNATCDDLPIDGEFEVEIASIDLLDLSFKVFPVT